MFGKNIDYVETLSNFLADLKKEGPLQGWEVPYFKRMFFRKAYGISDDCYFINDKNERVRKSFNDHNDPLRLIAASTREGLTESEAFRRKAWEYRTYKINEVQGMSFTEWMNLPPHLMESILNDIRMEVIETNRIRKEAEDQRNGPIPDGPLSPEQMVLNRSTALK